MEKKVYFRALWIVSLLILVSMACNLLTNPVGSIGNKIETAVGTAIPNATQIGAIATQIAPSISKVAGQVQTQLPSLETQLPSLATQIPTLIGVTPGQKPDDIPVMEGNRTEITMSSQAVIYSITSDLKTAVNFYKTEMPKNGWTQDTAASRESDIDTTLVFNKGNRQATVEIIDLFGTITVTIGITTK